MKNTILLGVSLILLGVCILGYRQFSYKTRETVLEVGPIKATADRTKTVHMPAILGWALIASGGGVLIFANGRKA